jgi:hypothetical protein
VKETKFLTHTLVKFSPLASAEVKNTWIYTVTWLSDYRLVLDWWLDLFDTYTTRDYPSQITITHSPVFSVTLLPTADVPLLPGSRPRRLATIPLQPHYPLTADTGLYTGSESLYDGRFNAIQFVLAPSLLRLMTRVYRRKADSFINPRHGPHREHRLQQFLAYFPYFEKIE